METILDQPFSDKSEEGIVLYAGFWPRLWAMLIDWLVVVVFTLPVLIYNILNWKSIPLMIAVSGLSLAYKPFMELNYGATLGKMALKIKVVNYEFERLKLSEALLRNIFTLGLGFISIVTAIFVFAEPEFKEISSWTDYTVFSQNYDSTNWVNYLTFFIYVVEMIVLLNDTQKRSLHDKIGKTYVIKN